MPDGKIHNRDDLRAHYGEESDLSKRKTLSRLDPHCRNFIAASPFLVMASSDGSGACDASPKGDAPGFVAVLDDQTLAIPDRPGNRRTDSMGNLMDNPQLGLIFFVPGMNETLRVNGTAEITTDPALLARFAVNGKPPLSAIVMHVAEAYLHCGKALIRSRLWDPERRIDRATFPSLGKMIADQVGDIDVDEADARVEESYRERLY